MSGINRFTLTAKKSSTPSATSQVYLDPCIFISHKREDSEMAESVGNILKNMDIDIWLDTIELKLPPPSTPAEHMALTESIEAGIVNSTHLLALISQKTETSWWVPYEVSAARARKKELAFLCHKDVKSLPSYFIYGQALADQEKLCAWAERLSRSPQIAAQNKFVILSRSSSIDLYLPKSRLLTPRR